MNYLLHRILILISLIALPYSSIEAQSIDSFISIFKKNGKTKIRLTGTLNEPTVMKVGETGEEMTISELPFEFRVDKRSLPITLYFTSDNYTYNKIIIPKKPVDDVGHIYLVKGIVNTSQPQIQYVAAHQPDSHQSYDSPQKLSLDKSFSINIAPETNKTAENTFALIIANENYSSASNVEMATYDGLAVKEYCEKTLGLSENQIIYCPNATYGSMKKAISKVKAISQAFEKDMNLIFYYAGHGIPDNATKDAYLMPIDADGTDISVCYSLKTLYKEFDDMGINQTVVFLDACFSGAKRDGDMIVAARGVAIKPKAAEPTGRTIVFSATSDEQAAYSYKEQKHGLFTYYFLKILQEKKGNVTLGEIAEYISKNVKRNSILINGVAQSPTITAPKGMESSWEDFKLTGGN